MKTLHQLESEYDSVFSKMIRLTYANENGKVKCYTCDNQCHWKEIDNGHFIPRVNHSVRWSILNCHPQCRICNRFKNGNLVVYEINLVKEHGNKIIDILRHKSNQVAKNSRHEILACINACKIEIKKLRKEKGL